MTSIPQVMNQLSHYQLYTHTIDDHNFAPSNIHQFTQVSLSSYAFDDCLAVGDGKKNFSIFVLGRFLDKVYTHIYHICLSIMPIYHVYLSCLSVMSIYLSIYHVCLSIISIYISICNIWHNYLSYLQQSISQSYPYIISSNHLSIY